jgi:hypothetical protein
MILQAQQPWLVEEQKENRRRWSGYERFNSSIVADVLVQYCELRMCLCARLLKMMLGCTGSALFSVGSS